MTGRKTARVGEMFTEKPLVFARECMLGEANEMEKKRRRESGQRLVSQSQTTLSFRLYPSFLFNSIILVILSLIQLAFSPPVCNSGFTHYVESSNSLSVKFCLLSVYNCTSSFYYRFTTFHLTSSILALC
jgi:hypothetical protein